MDISPGMVIGPVIGLAIAALVCGLIANKKRTDAWKRAAADLGLPFCGKENDVLARFGHLKTFEQGHSQRVTNAIVGDTGEMEIIVADYAYTDDGGEGCSQTICILRSQDMQLPRCVLHPERLLASFAIGLLGKNDLNFNQDPTFSSAYILLGEDEPAIRELFDTDTREWFVARRHKKLHFEADNDTLLFHTGRKVKPQETRRLMEAAVEIKNVLETRGERA